MNVNSKISKIKQGVIPLKLISFGYNLLNLTRPRRIKFSGHFHLNTLSFSRKCLGFASRKQL